MAPRRRRALRVVPLSDRPDRDEAAAGFHRGRARRPVPAPAGRPHSRVGGLLDDGRAGLGRAPRNLSALFDHHVHSDRSDGTVSLAGRAKSVAIRPHGVSDHYPWKEKLRNEDDVKRYIDDASRLGLRVGLEYDLGVAPPLSAGTRESLQYLIGAVHQIDLDGVAVKYDDAGAFVKGRVQTFKEHERFSDPALQKRMLDRPLEAVAAGIDRDRIDLLG